MRRLLAGVFLAVMGGASPILAEDAAIVSLETADAARGWDSVGKLMLGAGSFCTGSLIAPHLVLTAAHCLYDQDSGAQVPPEEIQFLAGWRNGRAEAYRDVTRVVIHPGYHYAATDPLARVTDDLALLELSQPIRLPSMRPFEIMPRPLPGDSVAVVSYAQDRAEAPSIQEVCEVLGSRRETLVLSCNVDFGSSGAPVFLLRDGVARMVSVISAKAEANGSKVALAVPLDEPLAGLRAALEEDRAGSGKIRGGITLMTSGQATSAKFVKPQGLVP